MKRIKVELGEGALANKAKDRLLIERGILLNFWRCPFYLPSAIDRNELVRYPGVEWRFQACKVLAINRDMSVDDLRELHNDVRRAKSANVAKNLGRMMPIGKSYWDAMSYARMLEAVLAKFTQNPEARVELLDTDERPLVEHRPDPIWGDAMDGSGKNYMGEILMKVREVLS